MKDVSGIGLKITIIASITYPMGITVTSFSDDSDPFDVPESALAEYGMGLNGDLVINRRPSAPEFTVAVIPGSEEDIALTRLAEANRVSRNKIGYMDEITATVELPNGDLVTFTGGAIVAAPLVTGVSGNGRQKTKLFKFVFEGRVG